MKTWRKCNPTCIISRVGVYWRAALTLPSGTDEIIKGTVNLWKKDFFILLLFISLLDFITSWKAFLLKGFNGGCLFCFKSRNNKRNKTKMTAGKKKKKNGRVCSDLTSLNKTLLFSYWLWCLHIVIPECIRGDPPISSLCEEPLVLVLSPRLLGNPHSSLKASSTGRGLWSNRAIGFNGHRAAVVFGMG